MAAVTYNWAQLGDWARHRSRQPPRRRHVHRPELVHPRHVGKDPADLNSNLSSSTTPISRSSASAAPSASARRTLLAQWYGTNSAKGINDSKANLYEVGALYNLSKRTMLKATWAMIDNDDGSAADFGVNAIGNQSSGLVPTGPPLLGSAPPPPKPWVFRRWRQEPGHPGWDPSLVLIRPDRLQTIAGASAPVFRCRVPENRRRNKKGAPRGALSVSGSESAEQDQVVAVDDFRFVRRAIPPVFIRIARCASRDAPAARYRASGLR